MTPQPDVGTAGVAASAPATYARGPVVDTLVVDGEGVVLLGDLVVRLGAMGMAIVDELRIPRTVDQLTAVMVERFGAPPSGSPRVATEAALDELSASGVVVRVS